MALLQEVRTTALIRISMRRLAPPSSASTRPRQLGGGVAAAITRRRPSGEGPGRGAGRNPFALRETDGARVKPWVPARYAARGAPVPDDGRASVAVDPGPGAFRAARRMTGDPSVR